MADFDARYEQIQEQMHAGQMAEAMAKLEELQAEVWEQRLQQEPEVQAFTTLAGLLAAAGQNPSAEVLVWQKDYFYKNQLLLAHCYKATQQWEKATFVLEQLTSLYPDALELWRLLGRYQLESGQLEQARGPLQRVIDQNPDDGSVYADLAFIANQQGEPEEALAWVQQGLLRATSPELLFEMLMACVEHSDKPFRAAWIELMVQNISETNFPILTELAQILYQQQDFRHTEYLCFHLLAVHQGVQSLANLYTLAALNLGHYAPALQFLFTQQEGDAFNPFIWYKLGIAYQRWQMPLFSRHAFYQVHQIAPQEEVGKLAAQQLLMSAPEVTLSMCLEELLKMALVNPDFKLALRENPPLTLSRYGIEWNDELADVLKKTVLVG